MINLKQPTTLRESALIYNSWGLSTIPLEHGSKEPLKKTSWTQYQYERMTKNQIIVTWQGQKDEPNLGLTGGLVSCNFGTIDHDTIEGEKSMMQDSIYREIRSQTFVSLSAKRCLPHVGVKFSKPMKSSDNSRLGINFLSFGKQAASPLSAIYDKSQLLLYTFENFREPLQLNQEQEEYLINRLGLVAIPEEKYFFYGLNHNGYKYVTTGDYTLIGKKDRSSADQKILFILMMQGKSKEDIKEFILSNYYKDSKFFVQRNEPDYYFEHSYNNCLEFIKTKKVETNELVQSYQSKIYSLHNTSDQKVFKFLLSMSTWQGTTENFFASLRTICDHTGIALGTASNSLKRLINVHKVIDLQKVGTRNFQATTFKEPLASTFKILPPPQTLKDSDYFDSTDMEHDVFRNKKGLGAKGKIIFDIIKGLEGCSISEIYKEAKSKGVNSRNTVKTKIEMMIGLEMIRPEGNKFYVNAAADLDTAADHLGTKGTRERNRKDFERQRLGFRNNRF